MNIRRICIYFEQIYTQGLAHSSYLVGSGDKCIVVDPSRNIARYLEIASSKGMKIAGIMETHLHADFLSGHMELAKATGAKIYAPKTAKCLFPHVPLSDGEKVSFNKLKFQLIDTPGHTPECSVYLVSDMERGKEPVMVFTGDTLLVGDVGRPDLFPGIKEILAEKLFYSLKRLKAFDDCIEVYPAHGMGSLCGRSLSAKLSSTIGNEKKYNYALAYQDIEEFKKALLENMPEAPDHFARCSEINRKGPRLISSLIRPRGLSPEEAFRLIKKGYLVLDTRNYLHFASSHIEGAFSIDAGGNLPLFAGWILPPEKKIILVAEEEGCPRNILDALYSVGIESIAGYIEGGISSWISSGFPFGHVGVLTPRELKNMPGLKGNITVIDNRLRKEWLGGRIPQSISVPAPDVRKFHTKLNKAETVVTVCGSGSRSMMAASILKQKGFKSVYNLAGGIEAWTNSGFPLEQEK
ncbi:MAG TPA: MBL fold metallo-hydrolase [bacterium]|nr:MBL fold metallo-hydrolase [bacterium]